MPKERVQKILANWGYCSRRKAEALIAAGNVKVNGKIISLGDKADPKKDKIIVKGKRLRAPKKVYYLLNKPKGFETTTKSTTKKPTVFSLIPEKMHLMHAGRLDADSRGLLLLTNDGEVANRIMHPRYSLEKTYRVKIKGAVPSKVLQSMEQGVLLPEGKTAPCTITLVKRSAKTTLISMTLHEGKNRQIRRMFHAKGFEVLDLQRVRIGPFTIDHLPEGKARKLKSHEIRTLKRALGLLPETLKENPKVKS